MKAKETVKGNKVPATLFVGVGGIGSRTIRKVSELAKKDDLSKSRFVILDTDVNDLQAADDNINITAIQTSSPRTIRDYLIQDSEARTEWFPNNMIINGKTVSEGAGQIRAISRLALNATIRQGRIKALYDAIDALYLKDGSDKKQTVKVVVASTVAGGTGSGIAMIVAMLIRNYITKNYPESSAIIRGFFIMPGVMDCNHPAETETRSMQRNGYATIKEINAFMMRPFFEAVPELRRYKNLHITVPTMAGGQEKLSCLPYDFCFLFDRTDADESNMEKVSQYEDYVAQSIYEQCIGPMNKSASSKEDNVLKEFLDDRKLGRSRFGGAGASVVRYPYEDIRDFVALEWVEKRIIGHSGDAVDEKARKEMISKSWLVYDSAYWDKKKEFDQTGAVGKREPVRGQIYTSMVETGTDDFSKMLNEMYISPKNRKFLQKNSTSKGLPAVDNYISELVNRASALYVANGNLSKTVKNFTTCKDITPDGITLKDRYDCISKYEEIINIPAIRNTVKPFVESVFNGKEQLTKAAEPFMLEAFLALDGNAMHPNAMRYLLYKLKDQLTALTETMPSESDFRAELDTNKYGSLRSDSKGGDEGQKTRDVSIFQVMGGGKETSLQAMCISCDDANIPVEGAKLKCSKLLAAYAGNVASWYDLFFRYFVCLEAKAYIERLIEAFENFYDSFEKKIIGIEKQKKTILSRIAFSNGDCVLNLFNEVPVLKKLVSSLPLPSNGGQNDFKLNAGIYDAVKSNALIGEKLQYDVFSEETLEDVFETVIVELYKEIVSEKCDAVIDVDILRAIALEHKMKCLVEADATANEIIKEELKARSNSYAEINAYVEKILNKGRKLSSPCITRKDFEESREVDAIAYNKFLEEGEGVNMPKRLDVKNASDTVSKYELHFFRSIYDIMPTQLQKMCSPDIPVEELDSCVDEPSGSGEGVGAYFTAYQEYMTKIGPDNRLNPVITPHIDKRWNSISVLPELDPRGYQRCLMKSIHQAMIYGFIYKLINKHLSSIQDKEKFVYRYKDGRNGFKKFIVSNHTKCDRLFEVLDALYFDRYAVRSIDNEASAIREKEFTNSTLYEKTSFAKGLASINRCDFIDEKDRLEIAKTKKEATSIFELPLLYWNSLPKKDASELEVMIEAIFDIFQNEIATFADEDDVNPMFAKLLVKHYKLLLENYKAFPQVFMGENHIDVESNDVIQTIEKKISEKIVDLDVSETEEFSL